MTVRCLRGTAGPSLDCNAADSSGCPEVNAMVTRGQVHLRDAHKTRQFWLIWLVLMLNVSAGIGVIGMASPMLQEIFGGALIGHPDIKFGALSGEQRVLVAAIAARYDKSLREFRARLVAAGKEKMVVRIALARKLLVRLNAKARDARAAYANAT